MDTKNIKYLKDISDKSVLIIEPHDWHAETIPGHAKYFADLGYNVDVFMTNANATENPMCRCPNIANIYTGDLFDLEKFLQTDLIKNYDFVFFNSITYRCDKYVPTMLHMTKMPRFGLLGVEHDVLKRAIDRNPELQKMIDAKRLFVLSNINSIGRMNPHWFGDVKITPKNKTTTFIAIGNIDGSVKNHEMLVDAIELLETQGITDFEIVVVGRGNLNLPEQTKKTPAYMWAFEFSRYVLRNRKG